MQNKKAILIMGIIVILVGAAAFIGGRMLNNKVSPLGLFGLGGKGNMRSFSINLIPAEELPKTPPEVTGLFVERKDKTIVIQSVSLKGGGEGMVVEKGGGGEVQIVGGKNDGPKIEIVITNETTIYRDTTQPSEPPSGENETIQETVGEGTLDDLNSDSMIRVWGRKSGDRIIAEILFYSRPVVVKSPGSQ